MSMVIMPARNNNKMTINPAEIRPKTTEDPQNLIFQMRIENIINMGHQLVLLSEKRNRKAFEKKFGEVYIKDVGSHVLQQGRLCDRTICHM